MPNSFTFTFMGQNSADYGIYATSSDFIIPGKRERRREVLHRHGTHGYREMYFRDRTLRLTCFWLNSKTNKLSRADIREITYWLSQRGAIVLDIEPDKYYFGELIDETPLVAHFDRSDEELRTTDGRFVLEFACEPFAYRDRQMISSGQGLFEREDIGYSGTIDAPTVMVIRNDNDFPVEVIRISHSVVRRS